MHRYPVVLTTLRQLSPTAIELTLQRPDGSAFPYFLPGQYATVSFPGNKRLRAERSFSIASSPTDLTVLRFGIRVGGRYTKQLQQLREGTPGLVALPFGKFTFDPSRDKRALFVAGGIGITPFLSMIQAATAERLPNQLTLLYSVRSLDDVPYRAELDALAKANANFRYAIAVSAGRVPDSSVFTSGRITPELIAGALQDGAASTSTFLCGPPPFMVAMLQALRRNGIRPGDVRMERFSASSSAIIERKTFIPWLTIAGWGIATVAAVVVIARAEQAKRAAVQASTWFTNSVVAPTLNANAAPASTATSPASNTNSVVTAPVNTSPATGSTTPKTVNSAPVVTQPTPVVTPPVQQVPVSPRTRLS